MPDILRQFIVFCGVGSINTVIGLAVILILSEIFGVHYILANALGYGVGLIIGFILHRAITFKNQSNDQKPKTEFVKFITVFALAYGVQLAGLVFMVQILELYDWLGQILAIGIYTVINYLGNRIFTFRGKQEKAP